MDTPATATAPTPPPPWTIDNTHADKPRFKQYGRKHPRELRSCLYNLAQVARLAAEFPDLSAFRVAYFRNEFDGVWRIGQTAVPHARETRLYVYALRRGRTFYLLTVGDKDTQQDDLRKAAAMAQNIDRNTHP